MPEIGTSDDFESEYMADLKTRVVRHGVLVQYEKDRATLDLGLHLKHRDAGKINVTQVRVWMQVKGLMSSTLSLDAFDSSDEVAVSGLPVNHVKFWYGSPEPVYLVLFVQSANIFLAGDVRELVNALGGMAYLIGLGSQKQMTLRLPKSATLDVALEHMPSHRSMRIDGPAFRGRPLGHNYDPLRSELQTMPATAFTELVEGLLRAHEFRVESEIILANGLISKFGKLYLTYEWVLPMTTEFGFDEGSDFRLEGEPLHAHGDVLVMIDPNGNGPNSARDEIRELAEQAHAGSANKALVFLNVPESDLIESFAAWRTVLAPLQSAPQAMGSLTFNVLTTTNLYLKMLPALKFRTLNYLR